MTNKEMTIKAIDTIANIFDIELNAMHLYINKINANFTLCMLYMQSNIDIVNELLKI